MPIFVCINSLRMYERKIPRQIGCGLHLTKEVLNGKWKANLVNGISMGFQRPSELFRLFPGATKRVLNVQLKELEKHGIVAKKIYPELPPKVEYSLTPLGQSLLPLIDLMNNWGNENRAFLQSVISPENPHPDALDDNCRIYQQKTTPVMVNQLIAVIQ